MKVESVTSQCPFCSIEIRDFQSDGPVDQRLRNFDCVSCGKFRINEWVLDAWRADGEVGAHLLAGTLRRRRDRGLDTLIGSTPSLNALISSAPRSFRRRLDSLLGSLVLATGAIGATTSIDLVVDKALGYARSDDEFSSMLNHLANKGWIRTSDGQDYVFPGAQKYDVAVLIEGMLQGEKHTVHSQSVFLSSTCLDLRDIRAELVNSLLEVGHLPWISEAEQFERLSSELPQFDVDGVSDSLTNCIQMLQGSDVAIVIIDRTYGHLLPNNLSIVEDARKLGGVDRLSATHLEVIQASNLKIPRFAFVRRETMRDYLKLKRDENATPEWTQWFGKPETQAESRKSWLAMMKELTYPKEGKPNWTVEFESIVDLRRMVLNRINAHSGC